ncbi:MAG: hypothetical protein P4L46_05555 [Fimbriimonas sp.]|nr:hypothetical protein [Fimbriimonas sp.]
MKKSTAFGIVGGVVFLVLVFVIVVAAGVGGEASKMDALLKADVQQHKSVDDVKKQLADAGYTIQQDVPSVKAIGPKHSLLVYTTRLTLDLGFNQTGALTSYHLDRA